MIELEGVFVVENGMGEFIFEVIVCQVELDTTLK